MCNTHLLGNYQPIIGRHSMAIRLITGTPGSALTLTACTPPVQKEEAIRVPPDVSSGLRGCICHLAQSGNFTGNSSLLGCQVAILSSACINPDSLIPSLIAFFTIKNKIQYPIAAPIAKPMAIVQKTIFHSLCICSASCAEFMVPFVETRIFAWHERLHASFAPEVRL